MAGAVQLFSPRRCIEWLPLEKQKFKRRSNERDRQRRVVCRVLRDSRLSTCIFSPVAQLLVVKFIFTAVTLGPPN